MNKLEILEANDEIEAILSLLRKCLIRNNYSMGYNKKENALMFFDTENYIEHHRFEGLTIKIDDLVN